jgi:glyoxylase-like metal-dependent hydrolase (beta-lactamase superfamily II)
MPSDLELAHRWFEHQSIGDGVTHIWEPYVTPLCRCNIWHIRGRERDLLIDSGTGVVSLVDAVRLITEKRTLAIATHTHFDHIGSHHEFGNRAVHATESDIMRSPTRSNTLAEGYVTKTMTTAFPRLDYSPEEYEVISAPATELFYGDELVDLGDRTLKILHLPGHTPGSLGLWEEETGLLFSGDAVYDGPLFDNLGNSSAEKFRETMLRLKELPVRKVFGGHYSIFGRDRFLELIEDYLSGRRILTAPPALPEADEKN